MTVQDEIIGKLLLAYNLEPVAVSPPQMGYRNSSYRIETAKYTYNLIIYKHEPTILGRIRDANRISDYLAAEGLPVRLTKGKIIRLQSGSTVRYACLYNYLPGSTIPWEAYTMGRLKELGKTMSNMHASLKGAPLPRIGCVSDNLALLKQMQVYFEQVGVQTAARAKLGFDTATLSLQQYQPLLQACDELPGQQALHMDFVRGNILFEDNTITGILDFEKTAVGHPVFDVARTLAFLLVDCKYKSEEKIRKYFLISGYAKRGSVPLPSGLLLERLVDFYLTHDFYKFLKHNIYESLEQNEHYIRTQQLLLQRGLIS